MTTTATVHNAYALLHTLQDNGGFTVDPITGEAAPREGYAVSLPNCEVTYPAVSITPDDIASHALDVRIARAQHGLPVWQGAWRDGDTVYLDASVIVDNYVDARRLALEYSQLAVFNLATGETIRLEHLVATS